MNPIVRRTSRLTITSIFLVGLLAGHASAYTNLVTNSGFESGNFTGWSTTGATIYTADVHSGTYSASLNKGNLSRSVATTAGTVYKVTGWIKFTAQSGNDWGGVTLNLVNTNVPAGQPWQQIAATPYLTMANLGNQWIKVALTFTAPSNSIQFNAGFNGGAGWTQVNFLMDDLEMFVKPAINAPPVINSSNLTPTSISSLPANQSFASTYDDPDGAVIGVQWNFGDGATANAGSGARTVTMNGSFNAVVTVSDDDGGTTQQTIPWTATDPSLPSVTITNPASDITVTNATLAISGSATGTGIIVKLSSDRDQVASASGSSSWSGNITLKPGNNRIIAQAYDSSGRISTTERKVRYVPSGTLGISNIAEDKTTVDRCNPVEVTFNIDNSAATDTQFPYEPPANRPAGLTNLDGISVDGVFSNDNFVTTYRRPGFLKQNYVSVQDGSVPTGTPVWCVRFAPPKLGTWQYRIEVTEAKGTAQSAARSFSAVTPSNAGNHGPIWRSAADRRYFEYADGTPFFGVGMDATGDSQLFSAAGSANENFCRWWITDMWGSAWWSWNSLTLGYNGIVPNTGLTLDSAYGSGLASLKIDNNNPISYQGVGFNAALFTRGKTYIARIRWRSDNITGPATAGQPYGACVRFTDWPTIGQTADKRLVIPHIKGTTPWHVDWATFTATDAYFTGCLNARLDLIFENATGGTAYIDEMAIHELNPDGTIGNQVLRHSKVNVHLYYDGSTVFDHEKALYQANDLNIAFKLNISEKQEYLINHLGAGGLPDPAGGNFNNGDGTPNQRLHSYFWRYLAARFGALRSVHSFEVTNEEAPGDGPHFQLTEFLSKQIQADGNPHMGNTSTWATLAQDAWNNHPNILFSDFHAYIGGTGWITSVPVTQQLDDTALQYQLYDADARTAFSGAYLKPVVWGEYGMTPSGNTDNPDPRYESDTAGVWLHKLLWARTGPGITIPLSWHNNSIWSNNLHPVFGRWRNFMNGIPLNNGRYVDAAVSSSNANLRTFGQKDVAAGKAHIWIDNKTYTWGNVVSNPGNISNQTGTFTLDMGAANANATFSFNWYDTWLGQNSSVGTATANGSGVLSFAVSNLAKDTAVKIVRTSGGTPATPPAAPKTFRLR